MAEDDQHKKDLEERLKKLEEKVSRLEREMSQKPSSADTAVDDQDLGVSNEKAKFGYQKKKPVEWFGDSADYGEKWLNRIGIGLLLLGVAFLFKYSVDQGWLIPPVRSAIGLSIGLVLLIVGLQMDKKDKPLKQILSGGGIAAFYITGFATFQLYAFVPNAIVWSFMIVVTLLALSVSLQQNEPVLSVTGIIGALGTPFMLYTGSGSVSALMLYTALVLGAAGWIYFIKGWRSLLWSMTIGGWIVVMVGIFNTLTGQTDPLRTDQWSLQAGTFICMIVFWGIPVIREILSFHNPDQWPDPLFIKEHEQDQNIIYVANTATYVLTLIVPVFSLFLSIIIWNLNWDTWGLISMASSVPLALVYIGLQQNSIQKLGAVHGFTALVLLTIGFVLLLEGNILFFVLAVEAAGLRYISGKTGDENISISSHILFGIIAWWLIMLLGQSAPAEFALAIDDLINLGIIAIGGLLVPLWLRNYSTKRIYGIVAHIFFLIWLYRLFEPLEENQAWITITWGLYAILLLLLGFVRYGQTLRMTGMATIFLVVGKLFLVDLSQLQAIWRILLFIGFGAVFLLLGYYWQSEWKEEETEEGTVNMD